MKTLREPIIQKFNISVTNRNGFHLWVVAQFVKCVRAFRAKIRVQKGKLQADGKSIMELLILEATWKSSLEIEVIGDEAVLAMESIKKFFLEQKNNSLVPMKEVIG